MADKETQYEILERETDFNSLPIYQEPDTDSEGLRSIPEATRVQEAEPGVNVWRHPEVKKKHFLSLW